MIKVDGPRQWLAFRRDETSASELIAAVGTQARLLDVAIEETEIEEIVRRIYAAGALYRRQSSTPTATPTESIATSSGEPTRPGTKSWCTSSEIAYATPAANAARSSRERAQEQRAEHGELAGMGDLAEHEIPRSETGAEVGDGGEGEDDGGPEDDRRPEAQRSGDRHAAMVGSRSTHTEHGEGTRCKSGTVPPL